MPDAVFEMTSSQVTALSVISMIVSTLSLLGSSFIIICYLKFKHLRKYAFKLVFMLSINDLLNQIGDFLQPSSEEVLAARQNVPGETSALCYVQAYTESFFELSSVLWTTAIAGTLYLSVFRQKSAADVHATFKWVLLFCWGVPAVLTIVPGALGAYGGAGAWCWILPSFGAWRFIQFYIPLWLAVIYNGVVYVLVIRVIKNMVKASRNSQSARQMLRVINRLRFYPLILVVVWGFATVNRLYESITGDSVFWLFVLQKTFSSMQGLLNALAYGASTSIRKALIDEYPWMTSIYYRCCCCGSRSDSLNDDAAETEMSVGDETTTNPSFQAPAAAPKHTGDDAL